MAKATIMAADNFGPELCKALGLDVASVRRVVIDVQTGCPVEVYVEMIGATELLDVDWAPGMQGAAITILDKE